MSRNDLVSPIMSDPVARDVAALIARYQAGETLLEIANSLGTSTKFVRNRLKNRIRLRPRGSKPLVGNPACFASPETCEEAAYFVGFLLADGCLYERRPGHFVVNVGVQIRDREVIDRLNAFVGGRYKVKFVKGSRRGGYPGQDQVRLAFSNPRMVADLMRHGMNPRKSFTAELPPHLIDNRHVWRGLVDGDGWFTWVRNKNQRANPSIGFCGSEAMVRQFAALALRVSPACRVNVRAKHRANPEAWAFEFAANSSHAKALAYHLYSDCSISLRRKQVAADEVMSWVAYWTR